MKLNIGKLFIEGSEIEDGFVKGRLPKSPYIDKDVEKNIVIREFGENTPESSLIWHRDNEDRVVEVIGETDWMFQRDNELPIKMEGKIEIPKHQWHRAIKGNNKLVLKITKYERVIE